MENKYLFIYKPRRFIYPYLDKLELKYLSFNKTAINYIQFLIHTNDARIPDIDWNKLSANPKAIPLLMKHKDKINYKFLCLNKNAIPLIRERMDLVHWRFLSLNRNAIPILNENRDMISWREFNLNRNCLLIMD